MQDTLIPQKFVLFDCDTRSIAAEFSCETPQALSLALSGCNVKLLFPERLSWRRVARRAFRGVPAFFEAGSTGFILFPSALAFYKQEGRRLVMAEPEYWTFQESDLFLAELDARHSKNA